MSFSSVADKQAMLQTAMVCTVILYLKTHFCFIAIGGAKTKAGKRAPEDTYQAKPANADEQRLADEALDRWQRVSMNDIENVFLGLIVIWAVALTNLLQLDATEIAHIVLTVIFTACRVAHTALYVFKISYGRSLAWLFGHFAILGLLIVGLINVF